MSKTIMFASVAAACRVVVAFVETLWMTRRKWKHGGDDRRRGTRDGRGSAGADGGRLDIAPRFDVMNFILLI